MENSRKVNNEYGYIGPLKVGAKGQIVIPKEVRDMFGISAGDTLMIVATPVKGIGLQRADYFYNMASDILGSNSSSQDEKTFAKAVEQTRKDEK